MNSLYSMVLSFMGDRLIQTSAGAYIMQRPKTDLNIKAVTLPLLSVLSLTKHWLKTKDISTFPVFSLLASWYTMSRLSWGPHSRKHTSFLVGNYPYFV